MESTYVVAKSCINNAGQSGTAAVRHWSRVWTVPQCAVR